MNNPILIKLLKTGEAFDNGKEVIIEHKVDTLIRREMDAKKMRADYYFCSMTGRLIFNKVLGKDANDDFYNDKNGNLEARKESIKEVIVSVLVKNHNES